MKRQNLWLGVVRSSQWKQTSLRNHSRQKISLTLAPKTIPFFRRCDQKQARRPEQRCVEMLPLCYSRIRLKASRSRTTHSGICVLTELWTLLVELKRKTPVYCDIQCKILKVRSSKTWFSKEAHALHKQGKRHTTAFLSWHKEEHSRTCFRFFWWEHKSISAEFIDFQNMTGNVRQCGFCSTCYFCHWKACLHISELSDHLGTYNNSKIKSRKSAVSADSFPPDFWGRSNAEIALGKHVFCFVK